MVLKIVLTIVLLRWQRATAYSNIELPYDRYWLKLYTVVQKFGRKALSIFVDQDVQFRDFNISDMDIAELIELIEDRLKIDIGLDELLDMKIDLVALADIDFAKQQFEAE